jgi:SAM-dependent methyltransferase
MLNGISLGIILIFVFLFLGLIITLLIPILLTPVFGTPQKVLDEILKLMDIRKEDRVVDLGCGDGRFVIKAYEQFQCNSFGFDLSPILILIAKVKKFFKFPFSKDILFEVDSIFNVDLKSFTKIYVFLDEKSMLALKKKFEKYIKKGGVVYSYIHPIPELKSKRVKLSNDNHLYIYKS